jgi:hypothetical protein
MESMRKKSPVSPISTGQQSNQLKLKYSSVKNCRASLLLLPHMPNAIQIILEDMAHVDDLMYLQQDNFETSISH